MKRQCWLAGFSVSVAVFFTAVVVNLTPKEPTYRGARLSDCLAFGSAAPGVARPHVLSPTAVAALDELGTNAIPTLKEMLRAKDGKWKTVAIRLSTRCFGRPLFRPSDEKRLVARFALRYLADHLENAQILTPVVPELLLLLRDTSTFPIGSNDAFYLLNLYLSRQSGGIRKSIGPDLVAALRNDLDAPSPVVRANAASLLAQCGADAQPAVPKLLSLLLHDADDRVQRSAGHALEKIDPDGAIRFRWLN